MSRALEVMGLLAAGGTCGWVGRAATGMLGAYLWRRRQLARFRAAVAHQETLIGGALEPAVTRATEALAEELTPRRATVCGYTLRPGRRHLVLRREHAYALCGARVLTCEPILPGDERPYPDECKRCRAIDLAREPGPK